MREIEFRGKRRDNGEWVYGDLIHYYNNDVKILEENYRIRDIEKIGVAYDIIEVIPETVGQFTGYLDADKKKIYEGDTVSFYDYAPWDDAESVSLEGVIKFEGGCWMVITPQVEYRQPLNDIVHIVSIKEAQNGTVKGIA